MTWLDLVVIVVWVIFLAVGAKLGGIWTGACIVGGFVEEGEDPFVAAQRELLEETGYRSENWMPLGSYRVDPNRGIAMGHLFLAREARFAAPRNADDLEEQELIFLTRAEVEAALTNGEFKVLAWAASLAFALRLR